LERVDAATLVLGAGLVGTFAARALGDGGARVVAGDIRPSRSYFRRYGPRRTEPLLSVDILDTSVVKDVIRRFRIGRVVLCTGPNRTPSQKSYRQAREIHVKGAISAAQACLDTGVERLVFVSSLAVYGRPRGGLVNEDLPRMPVSEYGRMKADAEAALTERCYKKLDLRILRPCGIYGPIASLEGASRSARFFAETLAQVLIEGRVIIRAPQGMEEEYLYVKDLGRAVATATLDLPSDQEVIFNVGPGQRTTPAQICSALNKILPNAEVSLELTEAGRMPDMECLDVTRIRSHFKFQPEYDLETGLLDYLQELSTPVAKGEG
jgi:nucleoside-diphosphate-sugar epimerase